MAQNQKWDKAAIKAALERQGWTLAELDRQQGLSAGTCSAALSIPHPLGERAISAALNIQAHIIWPTRYDAKTGYRHQRLPMASYKRVPIAAHRQKGAAA